MNWKQRIAVDKKILAGKPIMRGTRISVEFLLNLLAKGWNHQNILENYPQLKKTDIQAALKYAEVVKEEKVYSIAHTADLAGSGSRHASVREMKRKLDRLRNEDL